MSESLERTAELAKLARLLDVDQGELAFLADIPSAALGDFRGQVTDRMFGGDGAKLKRVALSSKLLPIPLTVKIAQLAFGPMLCAAAAGLLEPERAARISSKVPVPFLGDIAVHLDPRRAADVIAAVPAPVVVDVAHELLQRGEFVTMGRFVNYLPKTTLAAAVPEISDDADLLRVAFVMEGKDTLNDLVDVARPRFEGLIRTAYEQGLWAEALDLISHVQIEQLAELGEIASLQSTPLLDSLIEAVQRMDLWDVLLPVLAQLDPASLERLAAVPAVVDSGVLHDIAHAAIEQGMWLDLLPLSRHITAAARADVARYAAAQDDVVLERIATEAHDAGMWDAMLPIAVALPDDARERLARLPLLQREDVLTAIVRTTAASALWDDLLPFADALPDAVRPHLGVAIAQLSPDELRAALDAALRGHSLPTLAELVLDASPDVRAVVLRELLPVAAGLDLDDLARFAALDAIRRPDVLRDIIATVAANDLWTIALPLVEALPADVRPALAACIGELDRDQMLAALSAAAAAPNLPSLVEIAVEQDPDGRQRVLNIVADIDRLDEFTQLLTRSTPDSVWRALLEIRHELPDRVRIAIRTRAAELNNADAVALLTPTALGRARPRPRKPSPPAN